MEKKNLLLSDINAKCKLLLEENTALKNALNEEHNMQINFPGARRGISLYSVPSTSNGADRDEKMSKRASGRFASNAAQVESLSKSISPSPSHDVDNSEICISNFINKQHFNFEKAAFAVVNTVLPSIVTGDIISCQPAIRKEERKDSSDNTSMNCPISLFIKLRTPSLVGNIIRAKKRFNLLHSRDLKLSDLDQEDSSKIVATNIYINEVLSMNSFKLFQNLKTVAKSFGFKYVWHRRGSYLVKWKDGERVHVFTSAADLSAIAASYKTTNGVGKSASDKNADIVSK